MPFEHFFRLRPLTAVQIGVNQLDNRIVPGILSFLNRRNSFEIRDDLHGTSRMVLNTFEYEREIEPPLDRAARNDPFELQNVKVLMRRGQVLILQDRIQNVSFFSVPLGPFFEYCANQIASIYEERTTHVDQVALLNRRVNYVKREIGFRTRSSKFLEENIREF